MSLITVERKVLEKNEQIAIENRNNFSNNKILTVNIISSPGSGKTSIIECFVPKMKDKYKIAVIEGDVQTDFDARRIDALNIPVVQIVTMGGCHLDAALVREAYNKFEDNDIQLLIIENVGNLVCPAAFDLGEDLKITVISVTEGDDKPLKYPAVFRNSEALIINKIDLIQHLKCSIDELKKNALNINPSLKIFETSCYTCEGIDDLTDWLEEKMHFL
jgi:hydrogenase nickel incorporation protein HypB